MNWKDAIIKISTKLLYIAKNNTQVSYIYKYIKVYGGEILKKFFSSEGKFNIFFVIGLILIISGFFYTKYPISLIGLLIAFIPETKNSVKHYKETRRINSYLIVEIVVFITTLYIIISTMLGI